MEQRADLWEAAGFLGMSVVTLVRNYGHHRSDYQEDVRNSFNPRIQGTNPGTIPGTKSNRPAECRKVV